MYQNLIIVGNLGRDPEMRYTPDGTPVTNFSVATNRKWTNSDGSQGEETVWFRVTVWRRMAEVCNQYLSKGRQVLVEGRMTPDPESGGPRERLSRHGVSPEQEKGSVVPTIGSERTHGKNPCAAGPARGRTSRSTAPLPTETRPIR